MDSYLKNSYEEATNIAKSPISFFDDPYSADKDKIKLIFDAANTPDFNTAKAAEKLEQLTSKTTDLEKRISAIVASVEKLTNHSEASTKDISSIKESVNTEIQARKTADTENRRYATKWNIISAAISLFSLAVAVVSLILQFTN